MGFTGFKAEHRDPGEKCLGCHVSNDHGFNPHGASAIELNAVTDRLADQADLDMASFAPVACATCHDIHQRGYPGGIRALTDTQCQVCHTVGHTAFGLDHPAFTQLPAYTPQLLFDHQQHYKDHFTKQGLIDYAPGHCNTCHQTGTETDMQFADFDSMCSDCHLRPDIVEKQLDSIGPTSLIAIPRMDTEQLAIGYWPNCRTSRFKRLSDLPLIMRAMLETDASAAAAISLLEDKKTSLNAMDKATDEERTAATQLAWAIKKLVQDIAANDALERFSVDSETRNVSDPLLVEVITRLPIDIRRRLAESWFPGLDEELTRVGEVIPGSCPSRADWSAMREFIEKKKHDIGVNPGWYLQAKSSYMALSYVPQQHKDPLMMSIAGITQKFPRDAQIKAEFQCAKCHGVEAREDWYTLQWPLNTATRKTRFSHASHIASGQSCDQCHQLTGADEKDQFAVLDHLPIKNQQCAECHNGEAAQQQCVLCHGYHWQGFSSPVLATNPL